MDKHDKIWIQALGLDPGQFSPCPKTTPLLSWGLENQVVNEQEYLKWASEYYQLPLLDPNFFKLSWDQGLREKHQTSTTWSSTCYPVYEWEDVLYLACLKPHAIESSKTLCFLLTPFSSLQEGFARKSPPPLQSRAKLEKAENQEPSESALIASTPLPPPPLFADDSEPIPSTDIRGDITINHEEVALPDEKPSPDQDFSPLDESFSFASLGEASSDTATEVALSAASETASGTLPPPMPVEALEPQSPPIPNLNLGLDQNSEHDSENISENSQELNRDDHSGNNLEQSTEQDSGLEFNFSMEMAPPPANAHARETPPLPAPPSHPTDDSYLDSSSEDPPLPPPADGHLGLLQKKLRPEPLDSSKTEGATVPNPENPQLRAVNGKKTDSPHLKPHQRWLDSDLKQAHAIDQTKNLEQIITSLVASLKDDFQKIMWVDYDPEKKTYFPKKVLGQWSPNAQSWQRPLNTAEPGMFRISHLSSLPFHGPVSVNSVNQLFFDDWNSGEVPDHLTIYPLMKNKELCLGLFLGLGKADRFHFKSTITKMDSLFELATKQLIKTDPRKAG